MQNKHLEMQFLLSVYPIAELREQSSYLKNTFFIYSFYKSLFAQIGAMFLSVCCFISRYQKIVDRFLQLDLEKSDVKGFLQNFVLPVSKGQSVDWWRLDFLTDEDCRLVDWWRLDLLTGEDCQLVGWWRLQTCWLVKTTDLLTGED